MSSPAHVYGAFGLTVRSNVELRSLALSTGDGRSVVLRLNPPVDRITEPGGRPSFAAGLERMWRSEEGWLLRYAAPRGDDSWTMSVASDGATIDITRTPGIDLQDLLQVVQSVGLAAALQQQGVLLLHGCAADVAGRAVLVVGPAGSGKSTTAAAFVRHGIPLLSDDIGAVEPAGDALIVHPGPQRLRIEPDAARAMGWDPAALPRVFATALLGDKRFVQLSVEDGTYCSEPREIGAIYVLGSRIRAATPIFEQLPPDRALAALKANGYRDALLDKVQHAERFSLLVRLAREVPVHTVRAPDDHVALPDLVNRLLSGTRL